MVNENILINQTKNAVITKFFYLKTKKTYYKTNWVSSDYDFVFEERLILFSIIQETIISLY